MEIVDVSLWEVSEDLTTGTREKRWLLYQKNKFLFKEPKIYGEIYAELVAFLIGTNLYRLNIPETQVGIRSGIFGILSRNFVRKEENCSFEESVDFFR